MSILLIGLLLFFLPHLLREFGWRDWVSNALPSPAAYMGLYSLVSLAGLGLIIWGKSLSPFTMVWQPVYELRFISHMLMIPATILVAAGNLPMSYLRKHLRHPMLLGVILWGLAHLWSNGDAASMVLFGSFVLWGLVKFTSLSLSASASGKKPSLLWDGIALASGLIGYALISIFHGQLFGVGLNFV